MRVCVAGVGAWREEEGLVKGALCVIGVWYEKKVLFVFLNSEQQQ